MRRLILLLATIGATVLLASGVAYALDVRCDAASDPDTAPGQCLGTPDDDEIFGTARPDVIRALNGFDDVFARAGRDELNGGNLGDRLIGEDGSDTYFGGSGADFFTEIPEECCEEPPYTGNDIMDGGDGPDFMDAGEGDDVLRGRAGDERGNAGGSADPAMFGDFGDDKLYGGPGDDGMIGGEGADEHYGGPDSDFIDAVDFESLDTPDLVNGGDGYDVCLVNENDAPVVNCERIETEPNPTPVTAVGAR